MCRHIKQFIQTEHKSWQERHTWSPPPLPSSSLVFSPSPFKPYMSKTHKNLGLKTTRGEDLSKSFTIQSLYQALDLGLKTIRGDYLSREKSQFLHYLITPKHHMINPYPSLEPPPDVAGAHTGGVSLAEMKKQIPAILPRKPSRLRWRNRRQRQQLPQKDKVNIWSYIISYFLWKLTHLTISYLRASKWTVTTYPWNSVAWLHIFFYLFSKKLINLTERTRKFWKFSVEKTHAGKESFNLTKE